MNEVISIMVSLILMFVLGGGIVFWLGRGLFGKYVKAFISGKVLIRVHLNKGGSTFRLGDHVPGGSMVAFPLFSKKDLRYMSIVKGAIVPGVRIHWADVDENNTAPFIFSKVVSVPEEVEVFDLDDEGNKQFNEEDKKKENPLIKTITRIKYNFFEGYNDNAIIRQVYQWALMRPKRKIPGLGIDIKQLLIILVVVVAVIIFFIQFKSGMGGGAADNVIG